MQRPLVGQRDDDDARMGGLLRRRPLRRHGGAVGLLGAAEPGGDRGAAAGEAAIDRSISAGISTTSTAARARAYANLGKLLPAGAIATLIR